jgi:hypothetical protein
VLKIVLIKGVKRGKESKFYSKVLNEEKGGKGG